MFLSFIVSVIFTNRQSSVKFFVPLSMQSTSPTARAFSSKYSAESIYSLMFSVAISLVLSRYLILSLTSIILVCSLYILNVYSFTVSSRPLNVTPSPAVIRYIQPAVYAVSGTSVYSSFSFDVTTKFSGVSPVYANKVMYSHTLFAVISSSHISVIG